MTEENAAVVAAESLGYDVVQGILDELQQVPGFANLTQAQQQVHLSRMDQRVRQLIAQALRIIFGAQYPACVGVLGPVTFGKAIRFPVEVERSAESRHELADRNGQKVVLVMADPEQYYARMTEIKARADQRDLFHDPSQPLGHMGTPDKPSSPQGDIFDDSAGGETGLDDALPPAGEAEESPPAPIMFNSVMLEEAGLVGPWPIDWTDQQLEEATIWAYAALQAKADGREAPEVPLFLRPHIPTPQVEVLEGEAPTEGRTAPAHPEPIDIPDAAIDAEIVAGLKLRHIVVRVKTVRNWSGSQRIAAISWLQNRSSQRPDFLPSPSDERPPEAA